MELSIGRALPLFSCVLCAALVGCEKHGAGTAGSPSGAPTSTSAATSTAKATATAAMTAVMMAPPALPPGRSAMPTLDEWGSMKEVNVKGSSALKCETKMVREYLRVSCRDKNDTGGTPTTVKMLKGGRDALLFASGGVTSLIIPFVEGMYAEAQFSWTDKSHKLLLVWPKGKPMPPILGTFEGAASPLDGPVAGDAKKLCDCHKQVTKAATCDDMMGGANSDCDRTYGNNCQRLLECSRGEPSTMPTCLPGSMLSFGNRCLKECGAGDTCAAGFTCNKDMTSKGVCIEM